MERFTERAEINKCPGIWVKEGFADKDVRTWFNGYDNGYSAINKLADYEDLEEQKRLIKLPCAVGDTVWYISEKIEKHGRNNVTVLFVEEGTVDNITIGCTIVPQITVCSSENVWTTFDYDEHTDRDFFLMKEEAESALKILTELEMLKPVCLPGNYVWQVNTERNIISEYEVTDIRYGINKSFRYMWILREGIYCGLDGFCEEQIGKTVFLTREQAEAALRTAGLEDNGNADTAN